MSFCAAGESVDGKWYRTSFMHLYVSFRSRVSKGGFPHINVYLPEKNQKHKKNDSKAQKDSTGCHNVQADVTK